MTLKDLILWSFACTVLQKFVLKKKFYWYTVFTYNTHIYMYFMKSLYGLVYFRVRRRNKKHGGNSIEGQHKEDGH